MKIFELKKELINKLSNILNRNEAICEADFFLENCLNIKKSEIILSPDKIVEREDIKKILGLIEKRINEKIPAQYLLGKTFFMGEEFFVTKNVLIPRPETELLVCESIQILKEFSQDKKTKILDIGTGSGCISVMIKKILKETVKIYASDISQEALKIAKINAQRHNVFGEIDFIYSDLFEKIEEKFDIIISNPPYIPYSEKKMLQKEVLLHEPLGALFAENEGLEFYEKIIQSSRNYLNNGGFVVFELGINQSTQVKEMFQKNNFEKIKITKDLDNIERIISAQMG